MPYGIAAARFGGLTAEDVINAWPLDRLDRIRAREAVAALSYWQVVLLRSMRQVTRA